MLAIRLASTIPYATALSEMKFIGLALHGAGASRRNPSAWRR